MPRSLHSGPQLLPPQPHRMHMHGTLAHSDGLMWPPGVLPMPLAQLLAPERSLARQVCGLAMICDITDYVSSVLLRFKLGFRSEACRVRLLMLQNSAYLPRHEFCSAVCCPSPIQFAGSLNMPK